MPFITEKQKIALFLTLFIGAIALFAIWFSNYILIQEKLNLKNRKTETLKKDIQELEVQLAQIEETIKQKEELEKQKIMIDRITRQLPDRPDAPGFLNALVSILATTGIIQEEVRPDKTSPQPLYTEIPYTIKAQGHYHAFGQFLTLLEQNPDRFMRVKYLKISNNIDRPSVHPIDMHIATFMFNQ